MTTETLLFDQELTKWTSSGWHAWHGKINYEFFRTRRSTDKLPSVPVTLYRGLHWTRASLEDNDKYGQTFVFHDLTCGEREMQQTRPYSWSYDLAVAQGFASLREGKGFVMQGSFEPHELLLDLTRLEAGCGKNESEVIVEASTTPKLCQVLFIYDDGKAVPSFITQQLPTDTANTNSPLESPEATVLQVDTVTTAISDSDTTTRTTTTTTTLPSRKRSRHPNADLETPTPKRHNTIELENVVLKKVVWRRKRKSHNKM